MMQLVTRSQIDNFSFDFITDVEINSSLDSLTDTAKLTIPKKVTYKRAGQTITNVVEGSNPLFKRGSAVQLFAGYDQTINQVFKGYISDITPKLPLVFSVQDEMYKMKQVTVSNYVKSGLTLNQLLTDILPVGTPFQALDVTLGWFRIKRSNVAAVLDHLRTHYGLTCNFRNGTLYAGLRYITTDPLLLTTQEFEFEKNIINDDNLIYRRSDDVSIKLKAISINDKNQKIEEEVGDPQGDQRTMYFYGADRATLKKLADENLSKMKYEGFYGSFETLLLPQTKTGDAVRMINGKLPEKNGVYLVKEVVTRYGTEGGIQTIHLDRKIA